MAQPSQKALTLKQPWATLIMQGVKQIENRSWKPRVAVGERFVIHAGASKAIWPDRIPVEFAETAVGAPHGVALGTVELLGYHEPGEACDERCRYFGAPDENYHWELGNPEWFHEPIEVKGALGMWSFNP